jgi:hypothetical protein
VTIVAREGVQEPSQRGGQRRIGGTYRTGKNVRFVMWEIPQRVSSKGNPNTLTVRNPR